MKRNIISCLLRSLLVSASVFSLAFSGFAQNVGIGIPTPTSRLDIVGTGSTFSTAALKVSNSLGTNIMYVRDDGFVGINNTSPGSQLDVKGTLRLSGSASGFVGLSAAPNAGYITYILPAADGSVGQVLSTDGFGNLYWATGGGGGTGFNFNCSTSSNTDWTIRGDGSGTWECTDGLRISSTGYVSINTYTSSSYRLRVNGNVGIGSSPNSSYELSVSGDAHITGYVGIGTTPSSSYDLRVAGKSYLDGGVGVGTTPPTSGLYVGSSSNFYVPTSITSSSGTTLVISSGRVYKLSSSIRYKENVQDLVIDKDSFLRIRPVSFTYKEDASMAGNKDIGVIAEEVEKLVPELVIYEPDIMKDAAGKPILDKDGQPVLSKTSFHPEGVKYDRMGVYLISIVAEQQQEIRQLHEMIEEQRQSVQRLQTQIDKLVMK